jgi:hypothetical protein
VEQGGRQRVSVAGAALATLHSGGFRVEPLTGREIVSRAIHFRRPPRLPVTMGCFGVDDTGWVGARAPAGWQPAGPGEDEWGCRWEKTEVENMGQVTGHPLADIRRLAGFRPPDYRDPSRYVDMAAALDAVEAQGKYVISGIFMVLFERMHILHGFVDTLAGLYDERPAATTAPTPRSGSRRLAPSASCTTNSAGGRRPCTGRHCRPRFCRVDSRTVGGQAATGWERWPKRFPGPLPFPGCRAAAESYQ